MRDRIIACFVLMLLRPKDERTEVMTEENTEETNSQHIKSHDAALASLRACFALYQEWQDGTGDWDTFVDWIDDERPHAPEGG